MSMSLKFTPKFSFHLGTLNRWIVLFLLLPFLTACTNSEKERAIDLPNGKKAFFLSQNQAKIAIAKDEKENFFDLVSFTDIEIQTKIALPDSAKRGKVIADYKTALQDDVLAFTREDKDFIAPILKELGKLIGQLSKGLIDTDIKLIKIGGRYYGPSIFYTRENCIIIPKYELMKRDERTMKSILAHEFFHIYTRYHPEKRKELYKMIGFKPLGVDLDQLEMPENLRNSILLNPDGVDYLNYITLVNKETGEKVDCIFLSSSNFHQFATTNTSYFPHLSTNFYPIERKEDGGYIVKTTESGGSPLEIQPLIESLFDQISNNTLYIIHPDEILADNFALLIASTSEELDKARENDKLDLLNRMESIISGED
ncbi:MAG: hypothetical protein Sapg2KO_30770 [Saprospiraceae bacterium]